MTSPRLHGGGRSRRVSSAILILHGGRERDHTATQPWQPAYLRMLDLYVGLRIQARSCAVYLLQHGVRGWNGEGLEPPPVTDARRALSAITSAHPDARIALLGHSMGGRTAMAVASTPGVVGVCALAPWLPAGEPLPTQDPSRRFVIAHGSADRTTSPVESSGFARRLRDRGDRVAYVTQPGGRHALLDGFWDWHRFAVRTTLGLAGDRPLPEMLQSAGATPDAWSTGLTLRELVRR